MKTLSMLVCCALTLGLALLVSCSGGGSSVEDTTESNLTESQKFGKQQKDLIIATVSSDAYEEILNERLKEEGIPASAANKYSVCIQSEFLELIENTPAENFNVSENDLEQMGDRLWIQAIKKCAYS